ncbi:hypothetical protein [uncultured Jatrophihabitans sp.]|uniref:hypothetical protein n=1 Tax=uncultured Jatrophihabitans sp. TaxID=1610747 RepID=UPI0035CBCA5A
MSDADGMVELLQAREHERYPRTGSTTPIADWGRFWWELADSSEVVRAASVHGFVLRVADLRALGVTRSRYRWAVRSGAWAAPAYGVVAPVDLRHGPDVGNSGAHLAARRYHAVQGTAAALVRPDDAVSGRTAAILHGLPTLMVPRLPELTSRAPDSIGVRRTVHLKAATLDSWQMSRWWGVEVSDVARTLVDLGREDGRDALMAADAALREGVVTVSELERALQLARGWPGTRRAREVLDLVDPRAESPLESLVRLALHDDGFPPPELQVWLGGDRVDLCWPDHGVVLEADGREKYTADERWAEKKREQRLRRRTEVRTVERVTWSDVTRGWAQTSEQLWASLGLAPPPPAEPNSSRLVSRDGRDFVADHDHLD